MSTKSKGVSVRQKLLALSASLKVPYPRIETAFFIERLVARLVADSELFRRLVFKGGFVAMKVYDSPRYTIDLDALLVKSDIESTLSMARKQVEMDLDDGVWFRFESQIDLQTQGEYGGIRQAYRAGTGEVLKDIRKAQVIHFDLGIGDPVVPKPRKMETPMALQAGKSIEWMVYPIETIIAEKLHAVVSHGETNSRSKDVHDLAIFLPKADPHILAQAIRACFGYRKTEIPKKFSLTLSKLDTTNLERGWPSAVASVRNPPSFKLAFETVLVELKRMDKII